MRNKLIFAALFLSMLTSGGLAGPDWTEPPGDAGSTPGSAQNTTGVGPLRLIAGNLFAVQSRSAEAGGDFEDVYRIRICDPRLFCARTSSNFNAQLWLFTDEGFGVLGNDDGLEGREPAIFPPADDQTQQRIPGPGVYLIAISGFNNDPIGIGPLGSGGPIFNQKTPTERSGPDGPGGQFPLMQWTGPGETGSYMIRLEGVAFADDDCASGDYVQNPCVPALTEWGAAVCLLALLTGGTLMLGRKPAADE